MISDILIANNIFSLKIHFIWSFFAFSIYQDLLSDLSFPQGICWLLGAVEQLTVMILFGNFETIS